MEVWRSIPSLPGYEVSNCGRVRSVDRWLWRRPSRRHPDPEGWRRFYPGVMLKLRVGNHGYWTVAINKTPTLVHRLMLEAFIGPCPAGCESLHDDDCKTNNSFPNLRWGTRSQNVSDAYRNGKRESRKGVPRNFRKAA